MKLIVFCNFVIVINKVLYLFNNVYSIYSWEVEGKGLLPITIISRTKLIFKEEVHQKSH